MTEHTHTEQSDICPECGLATDGQPCPFTRCPKRKPEQNNIADDPYAAGKRRASTCPTCGGPVWIVYHGPARNHTVEQREDGKRS